MVEVSGTVNDDATDPVTVRINWGDGSSVESTTVMPGDPFNFWHTYVDDDPTGTPSDNYTITLEAEDSSTNITSTSSPVTVNNVPPTLSVSWPSSVIYDNQTVWVSGNVDDQGWSDVLTVTIDWGDGETETVTELSSGGTFSFEHQYQSSFDANYTVTVTTTDDDLGSSSDSYLLSVDDAIRIIDASGEAQEGSLLYFFFRVENDIGDVYSYEIDIDNDGSSDYWGAIDGDESIWEPENVVIINVDSLSLLGSPVEDGSYTATVRVTNTEFAWEEADFTISVANTEPAISITGTGTVGEEGRSLVSENYAITVSVSDPGPDTVSALSIDWGDGTVEVFAVSSGIFAHSYSTAALYSVNVTATDEEGNYTAEHLVLVENRDPVVTSAFATLLGGGLAELTVEAWDPTLTGLTYSWDLDADDAFDDYFGATVQISAGAASFPGGGGEPYQVRLRVENGTADFTEELFAFASGGQLVTDGAPAAGTTTNNDPLQVTITQGTVEVTTAQFSNRLTLLGTDQNNQPTGVRAPIGAATLQIPRNALPREFPRGITGLSVGTGVEFHATFTSGAALPAAQQPYWVQRAQYTVSELNAAGTRVTVAADSFTWKFDGAVNDKARPKRYSGQKFPGATSTMQDFPQMALLGAAQGRVAGANAEFRVRGGNNSVYTTAEYLDWVAKEREFKWEFQTYLVDPGTKGTFRPIGYVSWGFTLKAEAGGFSLTPVDPEWHNGKDPAVWQDVK